MVKAATVQYFKGLGTSTAEQARSYFKDLPRHMIVFQHSGRESDEALDLFFNKKRSNDRKDFMLRRCDPSSYVDYSQSETTLEAFVHQELLPQYASATFTRAIPFFADGFKQANRKVFFGCRKMKLTEADCLSVANAAGKIAAETNYHHRSAALEDTIVGMASDYAGAGNLNLLLPLGEFGTRHSHAAAAAAYPKVGLNSPIQSLLFPVADDPILSYVKDEGKAVEPTHYTPVIPTLLCFGAQGIAVGWSTKCPPFHPMEVLNASKACLEGLPLPELTPFFRSFHGIVRKVSEGREREGEEGKEGSCSAASPPLSLAWTVEGIAEVTSSGVRVTEVPPTRETDAYKEDWQKHGYEVVPGPGHTDVAIDLLIKAYTPKTDDLLKELGLKQTLTFSNVHLLNSNGKLAQYTHPHDIVREHATLRLETYDRRIAHLLEVARREESRARNRLRYLHCWLEESIVMKSMESDEVAAALLEAMHFDTEDGTFDYLLDLPNRVFTKEKVVSYRKKAEDCLAKVKELEETTASQLWRRELLALEAQLVSEL